MAAGQSLDQATQGNAGDADMTTVAQSIAQNLGLIVLALQSGFGNFVPVPTSASAPGTPGQVAVESGWLYICIADSTWERVAIATF